MAESMRPGVLLAGLCNTSNMANKYQRHIYYHFSPIYLKLSCPICQQNRINSSIYMKCQPSIVVSIGAAAHYQPKFGCGDGISNIYRNQHPWQASSLAGVLAMALAVWVLLWSGDGWCGRNLGENICFPEINVYSMVEHRISNGEICILHRIKSNPIYQPTHR